MDHPPLTFIQIKFSQKSILCVEWEGVRFLQQTVFAVNKPTWLGYTSFSLHWAFKTDIQIVKYVNNKFRLITLAYCLI